MNLKENILQKLYNSDKYVSGEELAIKFNVSRTAIWKSINSLREEGYKIIALKNKGYLLTNESDVITSEGIMAFVYDKTFINDIRVFKSIDSTNKYAKLLANEGVENGTVIIAEEQTLGQGRLGRSFYSPSNTGIYMTLILRPQLSITDSVLITTATSVAICRAIEKLTDIKPKIKWVNDIIIDNKKVCGILTEAASNFESGTIEYILLGIGVNFKTKQKDFPIELQSIATSLLNEDINSLTRNRFCAEIINEIVSILPTLRNKNFIDEYKERSIILNKNIKYIVAGKEYFGIAIDISDDGALIVQNEDGTCKILNSGEISIRYK